MKFGPVPVAEAEGAILAHSVRVGDQRLRKGMVLEEAHVTALRAAGLREVVVARLEAEDEHEDAAAGAVARALISGTGQGGGHGGDQDGAGGLRAGRAATGRVNLIAGGAGVVVLDRARIEAVNRVNPMITVATVPPYQQLEAGGLAATIKIISYGVPGADVGRAVAHARGAMRLARPVIAHASLIITEVPGGPHDKLEEKGREAIRARLAALGVTLEEVITVPHAEKPLKKAVKRAAKGPGAELILILTGSATSDSHDVAPEAVRQAGGRIRRFGMPVDPGNLLFVGRLNKRPVIGLPGCVRSPALNGADWVLARVICGLDVGRKEIAAMGVGGLLKEVAARGHPREAG